MGDLPAARIYKWGQYGLMEAMWGLNMVEQGLMRAIEKVLIQRKVWELGRKD